MTVEELAGHIDLSLLNPSVTRTQMKEFLAGALAYPFASVCIPPLYVEDAASILNGSNVRVGTVIGFPLGYQTPAVKLHEAVEAVESGAREIDVVMNISSFKSGEISIAEDELSLIVSSLRDTLIKVIIETCLLSDEEKVAACEMVVRSGAHFVKTSTGFGERGAAVEDIRLLYRAAGGRIKVKASGGIKTLDQALAMIEAGASRIGTSAGHQMLRELSSGY